jgi:putative membrane protein
MALAQSREGRAHRGEEDRVHMWFGGAGLVELVVVLFGLAFWGGLILLIVLGIRWLLRQERNGSRGASGQGTGSAPGAEDPLEILRRRYAAGEIDDEEYTRRRKTLRG